ncbi:MAG: VTT domain-containing protein [Hyphomonadaceae bacterium]|nr:VTT domain-containing protein [Hyphomonadaceae bacterium]
MDNAEPQTPIERKGSKLNVWLVMVAIAVVALVFLLGRFTDFLNIEALEAAIAQFADGPWGVPALILTFCACAFIGVPQFLLIGIAVYAFGPLWGAVWSWVATLCSGTITFWLGRFFGEATLQRLGEGRIKRFADFVAKNAFAASAIVRNVPTGPFLMVNMLFGAIRANYLHYLSGMALGVIPKIALVAFGLQAIQAALAGNIWVAVMAGLAAIAVFLGGFFYVRHRRRKGENIALSAE